MAGRSRTAWARASRYTARVRVLGVDLGKRRIGLAISDAEGAIAFPAGTIESRGRKRNLKALRELIVEREIGRAVIGLPVHMDGRKGPEAEAAISFAAALSSAAGIPVDTLDERWTSIEAERLIESAPKKRRRGKAAQRAQGTVDELAASIILKTYIAREAGVAAGAIAREPDTTAGAIAGEPDGAAGAAGGADEPGRSTKER